MVEVLETHSTVIKEKFMLYLTPEEELFKEAQESALYFDHSGRLIGKHWLISKSALSVVIPSWFKYLRK